MHLLKIRKYNFTDNKHNINNYAKTLCVYIYINIYNFTTEYDLITVKLSNDNKFFRSHTENQI